MSLPSFLELHHLQVFFTGMLSKVELNCNAPNSFCNLMYCISHIEKHFSEKLSIDFIRLPKVQTMISIYKFNPWYVQKPLVILLCPLGQLHFSAFFCPIHTMPHSHLPLPHTLEYYSLTLRRPHSPALCTHGCRFWNALLVAIT